ncbi:hypothetical protein [Paenibacillus sp.]|uniref:hypothetical protein n=1 Tax=Paenibacillus sp. TaxID=58172 RepID=UPI002D73198B|nr:hypothetical protein [Paenibacillus sp.]HZG84735.1 hypothetical protein [Paenibacillus sp.]
MSLLPIRTMRFMSVRIPTRPVVVLVTRNHQDELQRYLSKLTAHAWFQEGGIIHIWDQYSMDRTKAVADLYMEKHPDRITWTPQVPDVRPERWFARLSNEPMVEIVNLAAMDRVGGYLPPQWWTSWFDWLRRPIRSEGRKPDPKRLVEALEWERSRIYDVIREQFLEPLSHAEMVHAHHEAAGGGEDRLDRIRDIYRKSAARLRSSALLFDPEVWRGDGLYSNLLPFCDGFTERTNIPCEVTEFGAERPLPRYLGITLMRIVAECFQWIAPTGGTQQVSVRVRWRLRGVAVRIKTVGVVWEHGNMSEEKTAMEQRASIVGGAIRWSKNGVTIVLQDGR